MNAEAERFTLDTNVLVYSLDNKAGPRHAAAREIVDRAVECDCWLTLQALCEFYAAVTRKRIVPPADAAAQAADWLEVFPCAPASKAAVRSALGGAAGGRVSYWDGLLVATAREAGCESILSEDMSDGVDVAGLRVHNPFSADGGISPAARRLLGLT